MECAVLAGANRDFVIVRDIFLWGCPPGPSRGEVPSANKQTVQKYHTMVYYIEKIVSHAIRKKRKLLARLSRIRSLP